MTEPENSTPIGPGMAEQIREDIRAVLEGFDKGFFIRDVRRDHAADWWRDLLPYLTALARLAEFAGEPPTTEKGADRG